MESKLKLHEAIRLVLEEAKLPLTAREIADAINDRSLYSRKDGLPIPTSQIHARVKNYHNDFEKIDGRIALLEQRQRGVAPSSLETVINQIWKSVNFLRGTLPSDEYYSAILFLLSLKKERVFETSDLSGNAADIILSRANGNEFFNKLSIFFTGVIKRISNNDLVAISRLIDQVDSDYLSENFPIIFDSILRRFDQHSGKGGNTFSTPKKLNDLIGYLGSSDSPKRVFNPFAGSLSWVEEFNQDQIFAQENSGEIWAIGQLRLRASRLDESVDFTHEDSVQNWPSNELFDLVVSIPPFAQRITTNSNYKLSESLLLGEGSKILSEEGKLITVLSPGFLFREGQEKELRKELVEKDLIETIIQLPSSLFLNTAISTVCIVLNKRKKRPGKIGMFDASSFFKKEKRSNISLNTELIQEVLNIETEDPFYTYASYEEIRENDFNLDINRYFLGDIEGEDLKEFVKPIILESSQSEKGKLLKITHLKEGEGDLILDPDEVGDVTLKPGLKVLNQSALLVSLRWEKLKATVFNFEGTPIYFSSDIIALEVNPNKAEPLYLANYLNNTESVEKQVKSFSSGTSVPMLKKTDLLALKVSLSSLKEQKEFASARLKLNSQIDSLFESYHKEDELDEEEIAETAKKEAFEQYSSLIHSTGARRLNILASSETLLDFFTDQTGPEIDAVRRQFKNIFDTDITSVLTSIVEDIDNITKFLDEGIKHDDYSKFKRSKVSLSRVAQYFENISDTNFKFTIKPVFIDLTLGSATTEEEDDDWNENYFQSPQFYKDSKQSLLAMDDVFFNWSWELFEALVDNILLNANKHGYEEVNDFNSVVITLKYTLLGLSIVIQNNGKPFPKGLDKSKFIQKFTTNPKLGKGIGGADINRIANLLGDDDWRLDLDPINEYPVSFRFNFKTQSSL